MLLHAGGRAPARTSSFNDLARAAAQRCDPKRQLGVSRDDSAVACRAICSPPKAGEACAQRGITDLCGGTIGRDRRRSEWGSCSRPGCALERSPAWTAQASAVGKRLKAGGPSQCTVDNSPATCLHRMPTVDVDNRASSLPGEDAEWPAHVGAGVPFCCGASSRNPLPAWSVETPLNARVYMTEKRQIAIVLHHGMSSVARLLQPNGTCPWPSCLLRLILSCCGRVQMMSGTLWSHR